MTFRIARTSHVSGVAAFALTLGLWAGAGQAATVTSVGTADLATKANFIFHGKAVERWVAAGAKSGSIYTYMRFAVTDVIKGDPARQSVVLSFLGGTLNGRTLRVEGMKLPTIGDEGVYFVTQVERNYVQPFYGWDQGRFQVRTDSAGDKSVFTHDARPVKRVDMVHAAKGIAAGEAAGVVVAAQDRDALSLASFKLRIREIVEAQQ